MRKKLLIFFVALMAFAARAQNPGLIISQVMANPAGTDSCKEYVELLVSQNIDFSLTPYTIIVSNNGNASSQGWVAGGALSYAFAITSGSVNTGDVVYVGGSCMSPTGTAVRTINVKYVNGDGGIGTLNSGGVFGNGGGNADGVAVFSVAVGSITNSTVPVDALFYGTGIGSATVATGGYELPMSDLYSGGKLAGASFFGPDPGSDVLVTATGVFNLSSNSWTTPRVMTSGTVTSDGVSSVSLATNPTVTPCTISFLSNDTTVNESVSSATVYLRVTAAGTGSASVTLSLSPISNASAADYSLAAMTITIPANAPVNSTYPIVFNLTNDAIVESAEYAVLRFAANPVNANIGSISQFAFYIADNDKAIPAPSNALTLNLLSSFSNTVTGANSAEIVAHDPTTQRLYIANSIGAKLDIVDFVNPSSPTLLYSVPITTYGNINSVAVYNGTVAAAIENSNPQDSGKVVFFDMSGNFISQVKVGMMPDMITFNHAGNKVLTANEGEPNTTYTNDPEGSVSIIDISGGVSSVSQSNVSHVTFTVYNGQEATLRTQGIRIFGPSATAAMDFEPEYIAVSKDDTRAWVTLQENNAVAEINIATASVTALRALGTKNHSLLDNGMDMSNMTRGVDISNFPVKGFYMPDAIATYTVGGVNYFVTANEGDARAYTAFSEEQRVGAATLDPTNFPNASHLKNNYVLGRLNITNKSGDIDNDGDLDTLYSYGSRSFSIWDGNTGAQIYDSKDDFELITSTNSYSLLFNASNANNTRKDRSDDKGPEPEGVTIGTIGSNHYAFIALERIGGVMVYDVTNPVSPVFVTYVNNRSIPSGPDFGAEGLIFIHQSQSPNGQHIVIAANEISSTLSIWGIAGCSAPLSSSISVSGSTANICSANAPTLSVATNSNASFQWFRNGVAIATGTMNSVIANQSGSYSVSISTGTNCGTQSLVKTFSVNTTPTLSINSATAVCSGNGITSTVTGANTYSWSNSMSGSVISFTPLASGVVSVSGTASNNCIGTGSVNITVNTTPTLSVSGASAVCFGSSVTQTVTGANTYSWSNNMSGSIVTFSPQASTLYTITGVAANSCSSIATQSITVNPLPIVTVNGSLTICAGSSTTLTANGAGSYTWSTLAFIPSIVIAPLSSTNIVVAGTNSLGCMGGTIVPITVIQLPNVSISAPANQICSGQSSTLTASGAITYSWSTNNSGNSIVVSPSSNSSYTVTGTDANGCKNTAVQAVAVNATPTLNLNSSTNVVCIGQSATLTVSGANSYVWNDNSTALTLVVTPTMNATYSVTGTGTGNCQASAMITQSVSQCTSLSELNGASYDVVMYPNPALNEVFFRSSGNETFDVVIFNSLGAVVITQKQHGSEKALSVSSLAKGVYLVRLTQGENIVLKKLIVE